jgi:Xaa-Pro aminopeptidase
MTRATCPHTRRLRQLQHRLRKRRLPALLITNPADIRYLTGFVGHDSWALVKTSARKAHILTDFRFQEQVAREAPDAVAHIRKRGLTDELLRLADDLSLTHIALQRDHVTLGMLRALETKIPRPRFRGIDEGLPAQRAVKDDAEIALIRKALDIQQRAFQILIGQLKPGMTEFALAARLEYEMRRLGADGVSFPSIVAADANASLPHAIPGPRKIRQGGILLIDWGARYGGYCSDLTRVVALGKMPPKMREIYSIVLDAQMLAIAAIKPGVRLTDIDAVARKHIEKHGYGECFGHGLGHGIGLDIHEQPTLSHRAKRNAVLEIGHVVTVEPGIYLPGVGGVRIEDDVLVTPRGHRVLSHLPKTLDSAIV